MISKNKKLKFLLYIIVFFSIFIKISLVKSPSFTQFDEIINITNKSKFYQSTKEYNIFLSGNIDCKTKEQKYDDAKFIEIPLINFECKNIKISNNLINNNIFLYSLKMSFNVNYGPLNFFFSNLFLNKNSEFQKQIFQARIPFLVLSIFSLFFFLGILRNLFRDKETIILLLCLFAFSHMINIYEIQSIPWGISSLASITLIYFLNKKKDFFNSNLNIVIIVITNLLFFYFNWILIFLSLIFYLMIIFFHKKIKILISFVFYLLGTIPGILIVLQKAVINGRSDFLPINIDKNFIFNIFERFYYIFISNFQPLYSNLEFNFHLIVLFFVFIITFFILLSKNLIIKNLIISFSIYTILIYLFLNLIGKFPFKGDRHSILLYPQFIIILGFGLNYLLTLIKYKFVIKSLIYCLSLMQIYISIYNYPKFIYQYETLQNDKNIIFFDEYIKKNKIDRIITDRINILWLKKTNIEIFDIVNNDSYNFHDTSKNMIIILSNYLDNANYHNIIKKFNIALIYKKDGKNIDIINDKVYKKFTVSNIPKYTNSMVALRILNEK